MSANDVDLRKTMAMIQAESWDTLYIDLKTLSEKGDSHGMSYRLRGLLYIPLHLVIYPRHGEWQAGRYALHTAF
jgi:hypothetical protein